MPAAETSDTAVSGHSRSRARAASSVMKTADTVRRGVTFRAAHRRTGLQGTPPSAYPLHLYRPRPRRQTSRLRASRRRLHPVPARQHPDSIAPARMSGSVAVGLSLPPTAVVVVRRHCPTVRRRYAAFNTLISLLASPLAVTSVFMISIQKRQDSIISIFDAVEFGHLATDDRPWAGEGIRHGI